MLKIKLYKEINMKTDDLQIVHEKGDTKQPWRVMNLVNERPYIVFFCETKEIAQQFIKNPEYFQTPIEKHIKEYCK